MTEKKTAATSAQLRGDIDSGRTGDKIAANDPAAAPLGTDSEAGGAPPRPEEIAWARSKEISHGDAAHDRNQQAGHGRSLVMPAIILGLCAGFVIVIALIFLNAS